MRRVLRILSERGEEHLEVFVAASPALIEPGRTHMITPGPAEPSIEKVAHGQPGEHWNETRRTRFLSFDRLCNHLVEFLPVFVVLLLRNHLLAEDLVQVPSGAFAERTGAPTVMSLNGTRSPLRRTSPSALPETLGTTARSLLPGASARSERRRRPASPRRRTPTRSPAGAARTQIAFCRVGLTLARRDCPRSCVRAAGHALR